MKKEDFNSEWQFVKGYVPSLKVLAMYGKQAQKITLPHDAMIHETRDENTKNGGATGFYPGGGLCQHAIHIDHCRLIDALKL